MIIDASLTGFSFSLSGTTLTYTGRLTGAVGADLRIVTASGAAGGGVQLAISTTPCRPPTSATTSTATGAATSCGATTMGSSADWLGQANGGFVENDANALR